jgi:hypothetical protein
MRKHGARRGASRAFLARLTWGRLFVGAASAGASSEAAPLVPISSSLGEVKPGAAGGIVPTLRKEREEWGTHFVPSACDLKDGPPAERGCWLALGIFFWVAFE